MPSTNELVVTKVFDAPSELVWSAWTTSDLIARWFAPGVVMEVRELDVRPGGTFVLPILPSQMVANTPGRMLPSSICASCLLPSSIFL